MDHPDLQATFDALASAEWPVRAEAITGVRRALDAGCSEEVCRALAAALLALLEDPSWKVRQALVAALSSLPFTPEVAEALRRLADDTNRYVREAAIRALKRSRAAPSKWRQTLDKEDPVFQAIWTEIRRISPSAPAETVLYEAAQRVAEASYRAVAADVTHALNTVLLGIDGFAEQLAIGLADVGKESPEAALLFARLKERTALARRIVQNLREYSALATAPLEEVEASGLLQEAADLARAGTSRALPLPAIIFGEMNPVRVRVIRDRLACALVNVICNALEACGAEGAVTLSVQAAPQSVVFSVEDTGCGMSEGQLADATKRFTTNKNGGTGMGLAIAQRVVEEEHRGHLEIASAVGQGTTVRIVLPRGEGKESEFSA